MRFPIPILAYWLSSHVTLALEEEARLKRQLEEQQDAHLHKQDNERQSIAKGATKSLETSNFDQVTGIKESEEHDPWSGEVADAIRLYRVDGRPTSGIPRGSAVFVDDRGDKLYMATIADDNESQVQGTKKLSSENGRKVDGTIQYLDDHDKHASRQMWPRQDNVHFHPDNKVHLNGCVQGTSSFVADKCRIFNCCSGEDACEWPDDQIATVCPDSCNGYKACYYIGAGTYVGRGSCNGNGEDEACTYFAASSLTGKSTIGRNSCNGERACYYVCYSSNDCTVTIGNDACNGAYDCSSLGHPYRFRNIQTASIDVGDGSCSSNADTFRSGGACSYVGAFSKFVKIGPNSCLGDGACFSLGYYVLSRVKIGEMSCTGYEACNLLGVKAGYDGYGRTRVTVGDESCTGYQACRALGRKTDQSVQVGDNACTNYKSCYSFGEEILDSAVSVSSYQCTSPTVCAGSPYNSYCETTTSVPNSGGLCP